MVAQVASEAAVGLHRWTEPAHWDAFYRGSSGGPSRLHLRVRQWIQVKEALRESDDPSYFCLLGEFLRDGRGDISPIWYSSVIDFLRFCDQADSRPALQIRAWMVRDAAKWPSLPPALQGCVQLHACRGKTGQELGGG